MLRIGHRGFPAAAPANTMASFRAAFGSGCDWVECDCRASADGVVVLAHDATVIDAAGRTWAIAETTAEQLAALDIGAGEGVLSLSELVAWAHGRVGVMADVKQGGLEREIGGILAALAPDRRIVAGADPDGRRRFHDLFPGMWISTTISAAALPIIDSLLQDIDSGAVTLEHPLISAQRVAALHARGIQVYAWTVDDTDAMRSLAAMGVDGLITNRADLLPTALDGP